MLLSKFLLEISKGLLELLVSWKLGKLLGWILDENWNETQTHFSLFEMKSVSN